MATLANAVLPSESEAEDGDYEDPTSSGEEAEGGGGRSNVSSRPEDVAQREASAQCAWDELQAEEAAAAAAALQRRPPAVIADTALARSLHQRHPRRPAERSRRAVLAELEKYTFAGQASSAREAPLSSIREMKQRVREAVGAASSSATTAVAPRAAAAAAVAARGAAETCVVEVVRFAGEEVPVQRVAKQGGAGKGMAPKRRRLELDGELEAMGVKPRLRAVSVVEKSDLDWQSHRRSAGLDDLKHDKHAGALDRKAFLARATARGHAAERAAVRAAARAAARPT